MKRLAIAASIVALSGAAHAQVVPEPPHGSVLFPTTSATYYFNPGFTDTDLLAPGGAGEGAVSFWWNSTTVPPIGLLSQIIWAGDGVNPFFSISFWNTVGARGIADGTHLRLYVSDGLGHSCVQVSDQVLSLTGSWSEPVTLTWNTNVNPPGFFGAYGANVISWNVATSDCAGVPFKTPYSGAEWAVGASLSGANPNSFYHGMLAEVFGHFQDGDFAITRIPGTNGGYQATVDAGGATPIPLDLGTNCVNVFGLNLAANLLLPAICLRGATDHFNVNQGGDSSFVVPIGFPPPVDGATNPFDYR